MKNKLENNIVLHWLRWAREIQAIAQTGDHYALNEFQHARYSRLSEIAAEIIAKHSELSLDLIAEKFKSLNGYATPKVDVRGAVFREERILLVRELIDNCWTMPGGWTDVDEIPVELSSKRTEYRHIEDVLTASIDPCYLTVFD